MSYSEYLSIVNDYKTYFDRCGMTAGILCDLDHYRIIQKYTTPDGVTEEEITPETLCNIISSIGFFHDRVTKSYCYAGNIVSKLTYKSPDGKRYKREFAYIKRV